MRIMWRRFILAVLVCGMSVPLGAAPTGARDQRAAASSTARASAVSHRYVVLLDGIDSYDRPFAVSRARVGTTPADHAVVNDFAVVRAGILGTLPHAHIVYFSYAIGPAVDGHGNPALAWAPCVAVPATPNCRDSQSLPRRMFQEPSYKQDDTKNFDLRTHADGLNWLLDRIIKEDPQAEIDLVGFSLGGIVASLWAAKDAPTSSAASQVHALTLIESPVGGFALANQVIQGCKGSDFRCGVWFNLGLPGMLGTKVLRDLQLRNANNVYPSRSIVGELRGVAGRFDVTSIQSKADYLVNGIPLRVCDNVLCRHPNSFPVGSGTQAWYPRPLAEHDSTILGGRMLTKPFLPSIALVLLEGRSVAANHTASLGNKQTALWVSQALKTDGPLWLKHLPTPVRKPKILPVTWRTMYIAATDKGVTKVNLRAGPGASYPIIEQIPNGTAVQADAVPVTGEGGALWDKVSYGGQTGYILAELLSRKRPSPVSAPSAQGGAPTGQLSRFSVDWISRPSGTGQVLGGVSCPSTSVCVAVGLGILISTNGGVTWTSAQTLDPGIFLQSVSCPSTTFCAAAGVANNDLAGKDDGTIMTSTNGGATWTTRLSTRYVISDVSCSSMSTCLAVGWFGAIFASRDGGVTWANQTASTDDLHGVSCPNASTCVVVGYNGDSKPVLTSTDGGVTWTGRTLLHLGGPGLNGEGSELNEVTCSTMGRCIAVGGDSDRSSTIITSTDGGISWTIVPSIPDDGWHLHDVSCPTPSACVVVGNNGTILTSTDGGATWISRTSGTKSNLWGVSCASARACMVVGDNGTILQWRG